MNHSNDYDYLKNLKYIKNEKNIVIDYVFI